MLGGTAPPHTPTHTPSTPGLARGSSAFIFCADNFFPNRPASPNADICQMRGWDGGTGTSLGLCEGRLKEGGSQPGPASAPPASLPPSRPPPEDGGALGAAAGGAAQPPAQPPRPRGRRGGRCARGGGDGSVPAGMRRGGTGRNGLVRDGMGPHVAPQPVWGVARGSGLGPGAAPRSPLCPAVSSGSGVGGRSSPCGPLPPERGGPQHAGLGRRHPAAPGGTSGSGHGITSGN